MSEPPDPVIVQVRPDAPEAVALIDELEMHLAARYPAESRHGFSVERLAAEDVDFFVLRSDGSAAACAGILFVDGEYGEIKRMYVRPEFRGSGHGERLLRHLADHALARGYDMVRLETGVHQAAAIALYERFGFTRVPPFGPYFEDPLSRCYELRLG